MNHRDYHCKTVLEDCCTVELQNLLQIFRCACMKINELTWIIWFPKTIIAVNVWRDVYYLLWKYITFRWPSLPKFWSVWADQSGSSAIVKIPGLRWILGYCVGRYVFRVGKWRLNSLQNRPVYSLSNYGLRIIRCWSRPSTNLDPPPTDLYVFTTAGSYLGIFLIEADYIGL